MANSTKVLFTIEGDSSKAVTAIEKLGKILEDLPAIVKKVEQTTTKYATTADKGLKKVEKRLDSLNTRLDTFEKKSKGAGSGITSMSRRLGALEKRARSAAGAVGAVGVATATAGKTAGQAPIQTAYVPPAFVAASQFQAKYSQLKFDPTKVELLRRKILTLAYGFKDVTAKVLTFAGKALPVLNAGLSKVAATAGAAATKVMGSLRNLPNTLSRGLRQGATFFNVVRNGFAGLIDSARLATQGITNAGRALFFFVTIPVVAFLAGITRAAVDFEDAMIRAGKTTGIWGKNREDLKELSMEIREIAKFSRTSHVDLAQMAEQIGQLGVGNKDSVRDLVKIFDMLAITTDLSSDTVAKSMGKIANAFGWQLNTEEGVQNIWALSNAINELENKTASSAEEIVDATLRFAQAANIMEISAADAVAMGATLVAMGMSAEEAGTALRNMTLYMLKNREAIFDALKNNEKYNSVAKVTNELNSNAVMVVRDLTEAAANHNNKAEALLALLDIGKLRGGKALMTLVNNTELLGKNLSIANREFEDQNSLFIEYNRAMESTASHLGVLKNNWTDIGMTVGDAVLPVVVKFVKILIPALQDANKWFKSLSDETKLMYVGIVAAALAAGPLLMLFGQLAHVVTLIAMGFGQALKIIPAIMTALSMILPALSSVIGALISWPVLVAAAVVAVMKVLANLGVDIAGFFTNLADRAMAWGENLAANLADGILAGAVRYVAMAISWIANLIASFFESHSPPKDGPLSTIDRWGIGLMKSFLSGFGKADFSILSKIGKMIERILSFNVKPGSDSGMIGVLKATAAARQNLAKLIDLFNRTGRISSDLLNSITKGLGSMTEDVKNLITLMLKYNKIQREIADLEQRRKDVTSSYEDQIDLIGQSNMSMEERVAAIRRAQMERDDNLRAIDKEKSELEEEKDVLQDQLEVQQGIIDAIGDQEDIFRRIAETMKRMADAAERMAGAGEGGFGGFEDPTEAFEEASAAIQGALEDFNIFKETIEEGGTAWQGFKDGFAGLPEKPQAAFGWGPEAEELYAQYLQMYDIGVKAGEIRDKFEEVKTKVMAIGGELGGIVSKAQDWWSAMNTPNEDTGMTPFQETKSNISDKVLGEGGLVDQGRQKWEEFVAFIKDSPIGTLFAGNLVGFFPASVMLKRSLEDLKKSFAALKERWEEFSQSEQGKAFLETLGSLFRSIGKVVWWLLKGLFFVLGVLAAFSVSVLAVIPTAIAYLLTFFTMVAEFFIWILGKVLEAVDWLEAQWDTFVAWLWEKIPGVMEVGDNLVKAIGEGIENAKEWLQGVWANLVDAIIGWVKEGFGISSPSSVFMDIATSLVDGLIEGLGAMLESLQQAGSDLIQALIDKVGADEFLENFSDIGKNIVEGIKSGISEKWDTFLDWVQRQINKLPKSVRDALGMNSPSKIFMEIGAGTGEGFIMGVQHSFNNLDKLVLGSIKFPATPGITGAVGGAYQREIIINIHDPVVREEADLARLAKLVGDNLSDSVRDKMRYGGATTF